MNVKFLGEVLCRRSISIDMVREFQFSCYVDHPGWYIAREQMDHGFRVREIFDPH